MTKKIFFLILILGFVGSILVKDRSYSAYENRSLQTFPDFSLQAVWDKTFTSDFDTYVSDQFVFRDDWIHLKTLSDKNLFAKTCINNVYLGSDGYLINRYTENDFDDKTRKRNIDYINQFSKQYDATVLLVPTSTELLTEKLPAFYSHFSQEELLRDVNTTVSVTSILEKHLAEPIYFRTDHHWTLLGAYYVYEALVDNPIPYRTSMVSDSFYGTTFRKINLNVWPDSMERIDSAHRFKVIYDLKQESDSLYKESALSKTDKYPYYLDGNHAVTHIINETIESDSSLLIIKDSFANSFATLICNNYKDTHLLDLRYYNGSVSDYIKENDIDNVMFLYHSINFMQDKNLSKLLQ